MKVADLMTKDVRTCTPEDSLSHAAKLMWEGDFGALPVVNPRGQVIGMLTDRDICMAAYTQGKDLASIPVSTAAARGLISAHPDYDLETASTLMEGASVRRLPVVDGDGAPLGILSLGDIARLHSVHRKPGTSPDVIARTLAAVSLPHESPSARSSGKGAR